MENAPHQINARAIKAGLVEDVDQVSLLITNVHIYFTLFLHFVVTHGLYFLIALTIFPIRCYRSFDKCNPLGFQHNG